MSIKSEIFQSQMKWKLLQKAFHKIRMYIIRLYCRHIKSYALDDISCYGDAIGLMSQGRIYLKDASVVNYF